MLAHMSLVSSVPTLPRTSYALKIAVFISSSNSLGSSQPSLYAMRARQNKNSSGTAPLLRDWHRSCPAILCRSVIGGLQGVLQGSARQARRLLGLLHVGPEGHDRVAAGDPGVA